MVIVVHFIMQLGSKVRFGPTQYKYEVHLTDETLKVYQELVISVIRVFRMTSRLMMPMIAAVHCGTYELSRARR